MGLRGVLEVLPRKGGGDVPLPSHPSVFALLQFEHWQGQKGQTSEPKEILLRLGLLLQASLKGAFANASSVVLQPRPARGMLP